MSKNIVISFAKGSKRYLDGMDKIALECTKQGVTRWVFEDEKEIEPDCPTHQQNHYAFKAYAIAKAYHAGYDNILWLDSVVNIIKPLDKLFNHIETTGSAFFNNLGYNVNSHCNESCKLIMQATDTELQAPMIMACVMGLNRHLAKDFINEYMVFCNLGAFKGNWNDHRHDQTVASILIERFGYPILIGHESFFMYDEHINKTITLDGVEIKMTQGEDVCLISK